MPIGVNVHAIRDTTPGTDTREDCYPVIDEMQLGGYHCHKSSLARPLTIYVHSGIAGKWIMISSTSAFAIQPAVRSRLAWFLVLSPWTLAACGVGGGGGPVPGTVNSPPVIEVIAPLVMSEGQRITLAPNASDPDGDLVNFTFSGWMTSSTRLATGADVGPQLV